MFTHNIYKYEAKKPLAFMKCNGMDFHKMSIKIFHKIEKNAQPLGISLISTNTTNSHSFQNSITQKNRDKRENPYFLAFVLSFGHIWDIFWFLWHGIIYKI